MLVLLGGVAFRSVRTGSGALAYGGMLGVV